MQFLWLSDGALAAAGASTPHSLEGAGLAAACLPGAQARQAIPIINKSANSRYAWRSGVEQPDASSLTTALGRAPLTNCMKQALSASLRTPAPPLHGCGDALSRMQFSLSSLLAAANSLCRMPLAHKA